MKKIILTESQLKKIIQMEQENHISQDGTYMVLSNLIQMKNDIEKILNFKHKQENLPQTLICLSLYLCNLLSIF